MSNNKYKLFPFIFLTLSFSILCYNSRSANALPGNLYTNSRWIVDENGQRVKFACVNWVSHLETMVPEGLSKQPLDSISKKIRSMGFNCVRLTWPLFLATNNTLASSVTVRQSFESLGLDESTSGLEENNPTLLDLPLIQALQAVVASMEENDVMVILDNHISKPGWCCSRTDGNGFFGDRYFDPQLWIKGLTFMATIFNSSSNVVGMSLRNELRGEKQNIKDWYRYMQKAAEAVHTANPNVLIILSGLNFDNDLSFVDKQHVILTFDKKLVFELHWYAFTNGQDWKNGSPNQVCGSLVNGIKRRGGYIVEKGLAPLFISEFGIDQRGTNVNDNRFFNCFMGFAAELDLDWALWTLVGSYDLREGVKGMEEFYGALTWDWSDIRNSTFIQKLSSIRSPFRGPGFSQRRTYNIMFHTSTGLCVARKSWFEPLQLGCCSNSDAWNYTPQKIIYLKGTYFCIQAVGVGKPVKLGIICTGSNSKWETISDSKMHLSSTIDNTQVCLDVDSNNAIVTNPCNCLGKDNMCDPSSQWFKIVDSTRSPSSYLKLNLPTEKNDNPQILETLTVQNSEGRSII